MGRGSVYYIPGPSRDRRNFCCFMCQLWALHVVIKRQFYNSIALCIAVLCWCAIKKAIRGLECGMIWDSWGHWRSLEMAPFDRSQTASFHSSYIAMWYRFQNVASYLSKVANFPYPNVYWRPVLGDPIGTSPRSLTPENYCVSKKVPPFSCL